MMWNSIRQKGINVVESNHCLTYEVDGDKRLAKCLKTLLNDDSEVILETMCQTKKHVKL